MENPQGAGSAPEPQLTPDALIELANNNNTPEPQGAAVETVIEPPQGQQPGDPQAPAAQTQVEPPPATAPPAVDADAIRRQALQELSPLAVRVNEILQSGGTIADVAKIVSISQIDVSSISDVDAIGIYYRQKYAGDSEEKIAARMLRDGIDLTKLNSENPLDKAIAEVAIEEAALKAKDAIKALQAQTPQAVNAEAQAAQQVLQAATAQWQHVIGGINDFGKYKSEISLPGEKTENVLFDIPEDSAWQIKEALSKDLAQAKVPLTKQGLAEAQRMFNSYALALHGAEIIAAAISQAEARVRRELAAGQAGPPPPKPNHQPPKVQASPPKLIG